MKRYPRRTLLQVFIFTIAALTFYLVPGRASAAPIIYDTGKKAIGITGLLGGTTVGADQYLGVRFQADRDYATTMIGGHFGGTPNTTIFGVVTRIEGPTSWPLLASLENDPNLVGYTVFGVPRYSDVVWAPLSVTLEEGQWYSMVFGSGLFGASGLGYTPFEDAVDTHANCFWYGVPGDFYGQPGSLEDPINSTLGYFGLQGKRDQNHNPVPEPATIVLFAAGMFIVVATKRLSFGLQDR